MSTKHDWAAEIIAPHADARILEVGCGAGLTATALLARLDDRGRLVGLDRSPKMVERAARRNPDPRATIVHGELGVDPPPAGPFDLICSFDVAAFFADGGAALEAAVVLATRPARRRSLVEVQDAGGAPDATSAA